MSNAQSYKEYYDLDFKRYNDCSWDWRSSMSGCVNYVDSSLGENVLIISKRPNSSHIPLEFDLSKEVVLPDVEGSVYSVSVDVKGTAIAGVNFRVIGLNNSAEAVADTSVVISATTNWEGYKLLIQHKDLKALSIGFLYEGTSDVDQRIELKKLTIAIDNKSINDKRINQNRSLLELGEFVTTDLTSADSVSIADCLQLSPDVRFIGLGESTHGSKSIGSSRYDFLKSLILQGKCNIILTEKFPEFVLIENLYVQGLLNFEEPMLERYLDLYMSNEEDKKFLHWLKLYNANNSRNKINIFGIDNPGSTMGLAIRDFYLGLLGPSVAASYMKATKVPGPLTFDPKLFLHNEFEGLRNMDHAPIRAKLDERFYAYYKYLLSAEKSDVEGRRSKDRDSMMFYRTLYLENLFKDQDKKVVLLLHSAHLKKSSPISRFNKEEKSLGARIHERFQGEYLAYNFTFGSGSALVDSCSAFRKPIVDSMQNALGFSFEGMVNKLNKEYLFISTDQVKEAVPLLQISRGKRLAYSGNYLYSDLKKDFDGLIFINRSIAHSYAVQNTRYFSLLMFTRSQVHEKIIHTYKN